MSINFKNLRPSANYPIYPPYHKGDYLEEYFYKFYKFIFIVFYFKSIFHFLKFLILPIAKLNKKIYIKIKTY